MQPPNTSTCEENKTKQQQQQQQQQQPNKNQPTKQTNKSTL
jgi:hypothetical protein